jgi:hypothetical protein
MINDDDEEEGEKGNKIERETGSAKSGGNVRLWLCCAVLQPSTLVLSP